MNYRERLQARRQQLGRPARIGLVGAGQMGRGFVAQTTRIPGMEVVAVADMVAERAEAAVRAASPGAVLCSDDVGVLTAAIEEGRSVACTRADLLPMLPIDIVIEASGIPSVAASVAFDALLAGKHVGLLTVEADVTVGLLLSSMARQMGKVYTVCRGDEPVEAMQLVNYARDLGFEVVCAGKGKNNPMRTHATATELEAEAATKHMNPKMLCSFVDGSKTMIEMAALANAADLRVSRPGMHGPEASVDRLASIFRPEADGGILERAGVVDYATGPIAPGVFVIAAAEDPTVIAEMDYLKMGAGPHYAFYRPYHLASVEAPLTVASALLDGVADCCPVAWNAEVVAMAKTELRSGQQLEGIGGASVFGRTEDAREAASGDHLPLGLAAGARVVRDVAPDTPLTYADVELEETTLLSLRRLQDRMLESGARTGGGGPNVDSVVVPVAGLSRDVVGAGAPV
jgi:predicted homoserine dehydrogenase-like protein